MTENQFWVTIWVTLFIVLGSTITTSVYYTEQTTQHYIDNGFTKQAVIGYCQSWQELLA